METWYDEEVNHLCSNSTRAQKTVAKFSNLVLTIRAYKWHDHHDLFQDRLTLVSDNIPGLNEADVLLHIVRFVILQIREGRKEQ
jgi:hypothetical protein